ncbi:putative leader peptide [Streptomyces sp. RKAG293]|nr:putative leader peptide [Streptomyces sp. RKAG293]
MTMRTAPGRVVVGTLDPRGPVVHLYGRQHIDLQRIAGSLCCP